MNILTAREIIEIRATVAERSPVVDGGFTWTAIEALCDTVDALRQALFDVAPNHTILRNLRNR
jgi:hypothetical protein